MDRLEMLLGTPVDAMLVNPGFGSPENWKETTMQITQTNQNEMKQETCTGHERGPSSVAGMVMKTCCSLAALMAVMIGMPFSSMADAPPLVYAIENTGAGYPAPPLPTLANLPTILPLPDPFTWANDPINMGGAPAPPTSLIGVTTALRSKPRSKIMRSDTSQQLIRQTFLPATLVVPLAAHSQCV